MLGIVLAFEIVFWFFGFQVFNFFVVSKYNTEGIVFLKPDFAWLFLLPFAWMIYVFSLWLKRNKIIERYKENKVYENFLNPVSTAKALINFLLIRTVFVFSILALMQPVFGLKSIKGKSSNAEVVFLVDISNSMNTKDMKGKLSRLDAAKKMMLQTINVSNASQFGIMVFAGSVYPHLPLTGDRSAARIYINQLSTNLMGNQGTNIGLALEMGLDFFSDKKGEKLLVLITDAENHEGNVDENIAALKEKDIALFVYGLGSKDGGLVPKDYQKPNLGYLKDDNGNSVISKLDEDLIKKMATAANGDFLISNEQYPDVTKLLTVINNLKATKELDLEFDIQKNHYQELLLMVLLLMTSYLVLNWFWNYRELK